MMIKEDPYSRPVIRILENLVKQAHEQPAIHISERLVNQIHERPAIHISERPVIQAHDHSLLKQTASKTVPFCRQRVFTNRVKILVVYRSYGARTREHGAQTKATVHALFSLDVLLIAATTHAHIGSVHSRFPRNRTVIVNALQTAPRLMTLVQNHLLLTALAYTTHWFVMHLFSSPLPQIWILLLQLEANPPRLLLLSLLQSSVQQSPPKSHDHIHIPLSRQCPRLLRAELATQRDVKEVEVFDAHVLLGDDRLPCTAHQSVEGCRSERCCRQPDGIG